MEKLKYYLEQASEIPVERIETKVPEFAVEQRIKEKKFRQQIKKDRQGGRSRGDD